MKRHGQEGEVKLERVGSLKLSGESVSGMRKWLCQILLFGKWEMRIVYSGWDAVELTGDLDRNSFQRVVANGIWIITFLFKKIFFYWGIVVLQCCVSFYCSSPSFSSQAMTESQKILHLYNNLALTFLNLFPYLLSFKARWWPNPPGSHSGLCSHPELFHLRSVIPVMYTIAFWRLYTPSDYILPSDPSWILFLLYPAQIM